jgi:hypothetical protein
MLDDVGAASRPQIAGFGDDLALCNGSEVRLHLGDEASGIERLDGNVVAVAHDGERFAALTRSDAVTSIVIVQHERQMALPEVPRTLACGPDGWLVLTATNAYELRPDLSGRIADIPFAGGLAAATDPAGTVLLVGEDNRLATWANGELVDIPPPVEQIVACAALGVNRFLCGGQRHLFVLDVSTRELEILHTGGDAPMFADSQTPHLAAAPNGRSIAWCGMLRHVRIARLYGNRFEREDNVGYPRDFSEPDEPLEVRGLAFLDDNRLAIALPHGRGNIVDLATKTAVKLDPHAGDRYSRWLFIFGGRSLIAG